MSYPLIPDGIIPTEPLNDSYAVTLPNAYLRGDFEQGLARQVRKFRNAPARFAVTWPMTPAQYEIFLGWLEDGAGGLGEFFDVMVFRGDDYERMSVRLVLPIADVKRSGGDWLFTGILETMSYAPRDGVTTAAAIMTYGTDESLEDIVADLYAIVHGDLPAAMP
jgi:hypothetical protein